MDAHYTATKATYVRPRHYRERLMLEMEAAVRQHFAPLLALCAHQGQPNAKVGGGNTTVNSCHVRPSCRPACFAVWLYCLYCTCCLQGELDGHLLFILCDLMWFATWSLVSHSRHRQHECQTGNAWCCLTGFQRQCQLHALLLCSNQ